MLRHPSTNFEVQRYYQREPKFNSIYFIINLDKLKSVATHWIPVYVNDKNVTCFDRFEVEHVSKEIKKFIGNNYLKKKNQLRY